MASQMNSCAAKTYARRLMCWIRGAAKNAPRREGPKVKWGFISNESERENLCTIFRWAAKYPVNEDLHLLPPSSPAPTPLLPSPIPSSSNPSFSSAAVSSLGGNNPGDEGGDEQPELPLVPDIGLDAQRDLGADRGDNQNQEGDSDRQFLLKLQSNILATNQKLDKFMSLATGSGGAPRPARGDTNTQAPRSPRPRSISPTRPCPQPGPGSSASSDWSFEAESYLKWHNLTVETIKNKDTLIVGGFAYGPDKVEIDIDCVPPRFRFRCSPAAENLVIKPTRNLDIVLSPRDAFTQFGNYIINVGLDIRQTKKKFTPSNRGFTTSVEDMMFFQGLSKCFKEAMPKFAETGKFEWEEATQSFLLLPEGTGVDEAFPETFLEWVQAKKLTPSGASEQLTMTSLQRVSADTITEDHKWRQALLGALSNYLSSETIRASVSADEGIGAALASQTKLSLVPLSTCFQAFLKARLALRKEALKGCDMENPHVLSLLKCTPFSVGYFAKKEVEAAQLHCCRLNTSMTELLKRSAKRKSTGGGKKSKKARQSVPAASTSQQGGRGGSRGRGSGGRGRGASAARGRGAATGQSQSQAQSKSGPGKKGF